MHYLFDTCLCKFTNLKNVVLIYSSCICATLWVKKEVSNTCSYIVILGTAFLINFYFKDFFIYYCTNTKKLVFAYCCLGCASCNVVAMFNSNLESNDNWI